MTTAEDWRLGTARIWSCINFQLYVRVIRKKFTHYLQLDNWVSSVWCRAKGITHLMLRGKE